MRNSRLDVDRRYSSGGSLSSSTGALGDGSGGDGRGKRGEQVMMDVEVEDEGALLP